MYAKTNFFLVLVKLIQYLFSEVNVKPFNPSIGPSARIEIFFFLLSACTQELISTRKIITLQPNSPLENEKVIFPSNPLHMVVDYYTFMFANLSIFS